MVAMGEHTIKEANSSLSTRRKWYIYETTSFYISLHVLSFVHNKYILHFRWPLMEGSRFIGSQFGRWLMRRRTQR